MDIAAKLHSFDADIRYMGLSDMQKAISARGADPDWPAAVVSLLADTSLEVQNLAIRVVGELAALEPAELIELITVSRAPATVRAVALKAVTQHARVVPRSAVQAILALLRRDAAFDTIEGAEAVLELLNHAASRAAFADRRGDVYAYAEQLTAHAGLLRRRGFEILAVVVPTLSEDEWRSFGSQFVHGAATRMRDPAALALVGKLAGRVPTPWLVPELEDVLHISAAAPSDVDICEAALEALAALYGLDGFARPRADALAQRLLEYSEYGDARGGDNGTEPGSGSGSDDDMQWDGASDDSEWFDESSRVRRAAAKLAGRSAGAQLAPDVAAAALAESDESARATMYAVLADMAAAEPRARVDVGALEQRVLKDVAQNSWTAVSAGMRLLAAWDAAPAVARVVREAAAKRPALLHEYIGAVRGPASDDVRWVVKRALEADVAAVPETAMRALELATQLRLAQYALDAARLAKSANAAEPLRIAALHASGELTGPADWADVIPILLHVLRAEPALRPAALDALDRAASSGIGAELARDIVYAVSEILNVAASPAITTKCCGVLSSLPASVAPEVVSTVLRLKDDEFRAEKATVLMTRERATQPGVLQWALAAEALDLLGFLAAVEGDERVTDEALAQSDVPEVHAAAAGPRWPKLNERYHFTTTAFSDLSNAQLRVLLALAQRGVEWEWYSIGAMLGASFAAEPGLKGSIAGLMAVAAQVDADYIARVASLPEEARVPSFTAYAARTRDRQAVFAAAQAHEPLRVPAALAAAITSAEDLSAFVAAFEPAAPDFVIATIKLLHGASLVNALPSLVAYARDARIDSATRAEACMTLAWILQTVEAARTRERAAAVLDAFALALQPLPDQVQTLNIGPFKHRVDKNLVLRQAAIDGIYTCAALVPLPNYADVVDAVVDFGLQDEFEVKLVAYRAIAALAELAPAAVRVRRNTIAARSDEDVSRKLKDNAVKEDVEKQATLVTTINDLVGPNDA